MNSRRLLPSLPRALPVISQSGRPWVDGVDRNRRIISPAPADERRAGPSRSCPAPERTSRCPLLSSDSASSRGFMGRPLVPNDHRPFEVPLVRDPRHAQRPVVCELHGLSLVDLRMQWSVAKRVILRGSPLAMLEALKPTR